MLALCCMRAKQSREIATAGGVDGARHLPSSVLPLIWSYLLDPGDDNNIDPKAENMCIDFKSIASFFLVSKSTRSAFDSCNGNRMIVQALRREARIQEKFIRDTLRNVKERFHSKEWSQNHPTQEERQLVNSLLNEMHEIVKVERFRCVVMDLLVRHFTRASQDRFANCADSLFCSIMVLDMSIRDLRMKWIGQDLEESRQLGQLMDELVLNHINDTT